MNNKKISRVRNRYIILEYLRRTDNSSPSQISAATGISLPTVTRVLTDLVDERLVEYAGREVSTGGRPAAVVKFTGDRHGVISIYAHTSGIYGALCDLSGNVVHEIKLEPLFDGEKNVALVLDLARQLIEVGRRRFDRVRGLGVAVQSMVKQPAGEVVLTSSALGWRALQLGTILRGNIDIPVQVDSDHIYGVVGEWNYGAARHVDILVRLSLGPGASTGLIVNGEVFRGATDGAGELKWYLDDPRLGGLNLPLLGDKNSLRFEMGLPTAAFDALASAADAYEAGAFELGAFQVYASENPSLEVAKQLTAYVALAISSTSAILNPSVIVLAGQITRGRGFVIDLLASWLGGDVFQVPKIVHSQMGVKAVLLGAAKSVMDLTTLKPDSIIETSHNVLAAASR